VATDPYGSTTSAPPAIITVQQGPPQILVDLSAVTVVYAGRTATLPVTVGAPLHSLTNGNRMA